MNCTRCDGTGVLNHEQIPETRWQEMLESDDFEAVLRAWMCDHDDDVCFCDCCGDGAGWYGEPGHHQEADYGRSGPYAYNGGLPECW